MAKEAAKNTTTKKAAPKKSSTAKETTKPVKAEVKPVERRTEPTKEKSSTQAVVIAVLSTVIVCIIVVFGVLLATGVIKFSGDNDRNLPESTGQTTPGSTDKKTGGSTDKRSIIDNPNRKVAVKDSTPAIVKDLELYLPDDFKSGGKNKDGAYTYNLEDDDGWAQVLVYAEKSNLTPEKYLMKISPYLDITDKDYQMNGTHWVVGENANALAYATELDGMIYAIYYNVKLDSDTTAEAMQMIPKTLYMKRIYSE